MKPNKKIDSSPGQNVITAQPNAFPGMKYDKARVSHSISEDFYYLEYSFCLLDDREVSISITDEEGFYFIYCWQGNLTLSFQGGKKKKIYPFQSAIMFDRFINGINLELKKGTHYEFCVIGFTKPKYSESDVSNASYYKFRDTFCKQIMCDSFMYTGKPNLKLLDKINNISRMSKENVASEFIMEGLIYETLGLKMEQMLQTLQAEETDNGILTLREMEQIQAISGFIRENPSLEYTIQFLCTETGLSPAKLQEGFKKMHGKTAINFIRDIRLEKATELIKSTDMNISQIVYSIGLTSRSYFSKIFKKKYKCSPKFFQAQYRTVVETV
ncbi:AraC family transcriptional regulator [uncultured Marixanthomonas sp.]|uniref:helix-turn-helix domain-containing protein n=1 Tax=uncultured Marixanthomonas sp. TaxID=757245 RepID=UPI0030D727F9|tara:strand:+ start:42679 stop:43662 length:984 start_codon:yes stop_codon:yes gene_type:complete